MIYPAQEIHPDTFYVPLLRPFYVLLRPLLRPRPFGSWDDLLAAGIGGAVAGALGAGVNPAYLGALASTMMVNLAAWGGAAGLGGLIVGIFSRF